MPLPQAIVFALEAGVSFDRIEAVLAAAGDLQAHSVCDDLSPPGVQRPETE